MSLKQKLWNSAISSKVKMYSIQYLTRDRFHSIKWTVSNSQFHNNRKWWVVEVLKEWNLLKLEAAKSWWSKSRNPLELSRQRNQLLIINHKLALSHHQTFLKCSRVLLITLSIVLQQLDKTQDLEVKLQSWITKAEELKLKIMKIVKVYKWYSQYLNSMVSKSTINLSSLFK